MPEEDELIPPPALDKSGPIRRFLDSGLQKMLDDQLATLPEGKKGAAIVYADMSGARLAVMGKAELGPGELAWTVVADIPFHGGDPEAEAEIRYSW